MSRRADPWRPFSALRRAWRDEGGVASVEFVVLAPLFILVMLNSIEASVLMMRGTLLDRGLDMAMRELRLNTADPPTYDEFRAAVCRQAALLGDCAEALEVELQTIDLGATSLLDTSARCVGGLGEIVPLVGENPAYYASGAANELMMVRACLRVEPIVPNVGLAALLPSEDGGFRLVSVSAFVQEPLATGTGS